MAAELLTADRARLLLAIVEAQTFSGAAAALGITSSAVSRQVMRIEQDAACRIFTRDTHSLSLTREGEALVLFARALSDISEGARRFFTHPRLQGPLRVGITEDMTRSCLTRVLALFAAQFPNFGFEVTCDLSARLFLSLEEHRLDVVLGSHLATERRGELLRKLPLSWIGRAGTSLPLPDPVPLVLMLAPDGKREAALQALRDAGRPWRVLLESASLAAVEAAVEAGLGIAALGAGTERRDMADLGPEAGLPGLPDQAFSLDWRRPDQDWGGGMEAFVEVIRNVVLRIEAPQGRPEP